MKLKGLIATILATMAMMPIMAEDCVSCDSNRFLDCLCDPCGGWSFEADLLFWNSRRSGLDFAIVGAFDTERPNGRIHRLEPDWDLGYRFAAFRLCECCDFGFRYTRFSADDSDTIQRIDEDDIFATRAFPGTFTDLVEYAKSKYEVDLDMIDLEAGCRYDLCCINGSVRPFAGLKFTYLDQHLKTVYDEDVGTTDEGSAILIKEKDDMDAYGFYVGLEGEWNNAFCGIGLYGRTSFALSAADFERQFTQYDYDNQTIQNLDAVLKDDKWLVVPYYEIAVGLQYHFCDFKCIDWMVQVGYEMHRWCNTPDFINVLDEEGITLSRAKANIGFDGLFVRLSGAF